MSGLRWLTVTCSVLLLSACTSLPVSQTYLGSDQLGSTTTAPAGWQVFDSADVRGDIEGAAPLFLQGFGVPGVNPTAPMSGNQPGGVLTVTLHPGIERARAAAPNAFIIDLARAVKEGTAQILNESTSVEGSWERRRWLVEVQLTPGTVTRVVQTVMISLQPVGADKDGTKLHAVKALVIGCVPDCFDANQATINAVESQWRVR